MQALLADWFEELLNCISVLRQFVSTRKMAYLSADPFLGGHILSLKPGYFNPSTDMAPVARCLDHTQAST